MAKKCVTTPRDSKGGALTCLAMTVAVVEAGMGTYLSASRWYRDYAGCPCDKRRRQEPCGRFCVCGQWSSYVLCASTNLDIRIQGFGIDTSTTSHTDHPNLSSRVIVKLTDAQSE